MRLPRRAPRAVYRVYDEEEYLSGAGSEPRALECEEVLATERRLRRMAGVVLVVGASGALIGVIALDGTRAPRAAARPAAPRGPAAGTVASVRAARARRHPMRKRVGAREPGSPRRRGRGAGSAGASSSGGIRAPRPLPRIGALPATSGARQTSRTTVSFSDGRSSPRAEFGFERWAR